MKYSIDRIEGEFAVCESEEGTINIPLSSLPHNVSEGDIIEENDGTYSLMADETENARAEMFELQKSIFGKKRN